MSFEQLQTYYMARTEHTLRVRNAHRRAELSGDHAARKRRRSDRPPTTDTIAARRQSGCSVEKWLQFEFGDGFGRGESGQRGYLGDVDQSEQDRH